MYQMQLNFIPAMAVTFLLIFSFIFLQPFSAVAQANGNITTGASITAAENAPSWLSPSGEFAFGFQQLENSKDLFLLSIWYDKIPTKTIVWYANGDNPAPRGSKVELSSARGLVLKSPEGNELWSSELIGGTVARGVMDNTGNLGLVSSSSGKSWESFRHPADTMLPSQTMESGELISSKLSETNFSLGRFRMRLRPEGNLVLNTINLPTDSTNDPYFDTETTTGSRVVFNESGSVYLLLDNDQRQPLLSSSIDTSTTNFYYRATINFDGLFTLYQHPKNSSTGNEGWTAVSSMPDNICKASFTGTGSGTCGFNSVCKLQAGDKRPNCECPKGYFLFDPNNRYGDCQPNFTQSCTDDEEGSPEDLYDFEEVINTDWPTSDYALLQPFTEEQCRESCLHDCMCAVAIFRSGDMCWKKKLPLSNGRFDNSLNGKALIKIRKGNPNPPRRGPDDLPIPNIKDQKNQDKLILVGSVLLGGSVFFNIILVFAVCLCFFLVHKKAYKPIPRHDSVVETNLSCFTYKELEEATNGFKEELGKGAFGIVYKGFIQMSCITQVAVKKLNTVVQDGEKEFKTEVNVIGQTHHKNLVRLLGFCDDGVNRLLVYEFLSNGTLASFLFGDLKPGWSQRTQIALGIARGLLYLHEECSTQIIHCDIKPQNILLDDYYTARISDFGLAKLLLLDQSQTHTAIRGTKGYVAPEWFRNLPITVKVDVYSFGVLLLEIICCRRNVNMEINDAEALLSDWAYDCYCEDRLDALVEFDKEALNDKKTVERFVMVAIWCIQEDPYLRPTMRQVTQMLEGVAEVLIPPCPCPYTITH